MRMRKTYIALMVVASLALLALPATAKKPPKPLPPDPVKVSLEAAPGWVHEDADLIRYSVTVENDTDAEITVSSDDEAQAYVAIGDIDLTVNGLHIVTLPTGVTGTVGPGEAAVFADVATVGVGTIATHLVDEDEILAEMPIEFGGKAITAMAATQYLPEDPCDIVWSDDGTSGTAEIDVAYACIVHIPPHLKGIWEIGVTPFTSNNPNKPVAASVTTRDHIPGNWCRLPDGSGGNFSARWRNGDAAVTGLVYFPGAEGYYGDGVCYDGGAGGVDWFDVGNPNSFYLVTNGYVTFTYRGPVENPTPAFQ